jgi:hypothetical protein
MCEQGAFWVRQPALARLGCLQRQCSKRQEAFDVNGSSFLNMVQDFEEGDNIMPCLRQRNALRLGRAQSDFGSQLANPDDGASEQENDALGLQATVGGVFDHVGIPTFAET